MKTKISSFFGYLNLVLLTILLLKENPNVVHICLGNSVDRANKVKPTNHKSSY